LLDNGHVEHLGPLLRLAVDLARRSGDDATAGRARALWNDVSPDEP